MSTELTYYTTLSPIMDANFNVIGIREIVRDECTNSIAMSSFYTPDSVNDIERIVADWLNDDVITKPDPAVENLVARFVDGNGYDDAFMTELYETLGKGTVTPWFGNGEYNGLWYAGDYRNVNYVQVDEAWIHISDVLTLEAEYAYEWADGDMTVELHEDGLYGLKFDDEDIVLPIETFNGEQYVKLHMGFCVRQDS